VPRLLSIFIHSGTVSARLWSVSNGLLVGLTWGLRLSHDQLIHVKGLTLRDVNVHVDVHWEELARTIRQLRHLMFVVDLIPNLVWTPVIWIRNYCKVADGFESRSRLLLL